MVGGRRKDGGGVECSDNYIPTYVFDGLDSPKGVCGALKHCRQQFCVYQHTRVYVVYRAIDRILEILGS